MSTKPQNAPQSPATGAPGTALAALPQRGSGALALPPEVAAMLATHAKDEAALERPSISKISLRGGMLAYQGQPIAKNILPCVILVAANRNAYYDQPFDPNNLQNPVCFALGETGSDTVMVAHENVPDENVPPADAEKIGLREDNPRSCDGCAMNAWGSDPRSERGKACKETRRLVVLPASALSDVEAVNKGELAIIDLPVTSGKNYANFVQGLAASAGIPVWSAVTEISTERDPKTQFKVTFTPTQMVADADVLGALMARREQALQLALTPYDEVQSTNAGKMAEGKGVAKKSTPEKEKF